MSNTPTILFIICLAIVLYAYILYPLAIFALARIRPRRVNISARVPRSVSIVVAAYNEAENIARRVAEFTEHLNRSELDGEIIIVSDGSTDGTASAAESAGDQRVRVIELPTNRGKAAALNAGCAAARNEIVIFADARQHWAADALPLLLENFADPEVGAVSGDLVLESAPGATSGVGLYWKYEKWIRRNEAAVHSTVGVTGAICAVRRPLYTPLPDGTLLDDVHWPLRVAMHGWRVIHQPAARAFDRLPQRPRDEFRRKVRTLSGNFQLLCRLPAALLPWLNPIAIQFISHKLSRLLVPWCLLAMLALSAAFMHTLLWPQIAAYAIAIAGFDRRIASRFRIASAAASFLVLNAAAFVGFWVWLFGQAGRSWKKTHYRDPVAATRSLQPSSAS